jgi:hypothetical protein
MGEASPLKAGLASSFPRALWKSMSAAGRIMEAMPSFASVRPLYSDVRSVALCVLPIPDMFSQVQCFSV